jgi:hypothetical protein
MTEPNLEKKLRTLFYYDPDELGEDAFKPLGDDEVEEIAELIANQVREARIDEIKFFAGEGLDYIDASRQELLDRIKELGE